MIFGCKSSIIHPSEDIHIDIQAWISMQGQWISVNDKYPWIDIHVFMNISLPLSLLLWISIWISIDLYGYPCIDLLWILDPGFKFEARRTLTSFTPLQSWSNHALWSQSRRLVSLPVHFRSSTTNSREDGGLGRENGSTFSTAPPEKPTSWQTTFASAKPNPSSQTAPHLPRTGERSEY